MKLLLLTLLISQTSYARTADLDKINGHEGFSASAEGSLYSESGYKNETSSLAALTTEYKTNDLTLFSAYEYEMDQDSTSTKDRSFEQLRARYNFIEGFLQTEFDQRIKLVQSSAAGIGPYYHILNTAFYYVTIGTAYAIQKEEFQATNTTKRVYTYLSAGFAYIGYGKLATTIQDERNLKDKNDYRVYSISSVRFDLTQSISTNLSYRTIFYNTAATFPRKDTEMLFGASMSFK